MMRRLLLLGSAVLFLSGCDTGERLAKLEKQNQELQAEIKKRDSTAGNIELQAKCARDAKEWFRENFARDNDTLTLDYSDHYNKTRNQCFIFIEYHYSVGKSGSWINDITLWNVYENEKVGNFSQSHFFFKGDIPPAERVLICEMFGTKCKTIEEFNKLSTTYMRD